MTGRIARTSAAAALTVLLIACTGPQPSRSGETAANERPTGPKRISAALVGEIVVLSETARQGGPGGSTAMEDLLNAGLTLADDQGLPRPQLAENVPTVENGRWKVFPDGRMETSWTLKAGVKWHDGAPLTTDDLLFTSTVERDAEVPRASRPIAYEAIESVRAVDARTLVVAWKRPFIDADKMFTSAFSFSLPMPQHILGKAYADDKLTLMQHPFWSSEFVGAGPYRLVELVRGSHLRVQANPDYVLGRPKIDEIEIRLVQDTNTLMANILAGTIDAVVGGSNLSIDQALQLREQWKDGRVEMGPGTWVPLYPQLLNPSPAVVGNLQFRGALYHALDRQEMVDSLMHGLTVVAHSMMLPDQAAYAEIERAVVRYDYDPRKAAQMIEALGYAKGPDGFFRDASSATDAPGQRLTVEIRTTSRTELQVNTLLSLADYWQRLGVGVEQVVIPVQRQNDLPYRATFPAFETLVGTPNDVAGFGQLHSSKARVPENNFVGSNYSRYASQEFDALIDRYFVTIPQGERTRVIGQIIRHMSENLNAMPLFFSPAPLPLANRLVGAAPNRAPRGTPLWNVHAWDVR